MFKSSYFCSNGKDNGARQHGWTSRWTSDGTSWFSWTESKHFHEPLCAPLMRLSVERHKRLCRFDAALSSTHRLIRGALGEHRTKVDGHPVTSRTYWLAPSLVPCLAASTRLLSSLLSSLLRLEYTMILHVTRATCRRLSVRESPSLRVSECSSYALWISCTPSGSPKKRRSA